MFCLEFDADISNYGVASLLKIIMRQKWKELTTYSLKFLKFIFDLCIENENKYYNRILLNQTWKKIHLH